MFEFPIFSELPIRIISSFGSRFSLHKKQETSPLGIFESIEPRKSVWGLLVENCWWAKDCSCRRSASLPRKTLNLVAPDPWGSVSRGRGNFQGNSSGQFRPNLAIPPFLASTPIIFIVQSRLSGKYTSDHHQEGCIKVERGVVGLCVVCEVRKYPVSFCTSCIRLSSPEHRASWKMFPASLRALAYSSSTMATSLWIFDWIKYKPNFNREHLESFGTFPFHDPGLGWHKIGEIPTVTKCGTRSSRRGHSTCIYPTCVNAFVVL